MDLFFADSSGPRPPFPWNKDGAGMLAVCPDDVSLWRCRTLGLQGVLLNEEVPYIGADSWDAVVGHSVRMATSWFKDADGADFTIYKGVSLGSMVESLAWNVIFGRIYKFADAASRLIDEHLPQTAWAAGGLPSYKKALLESVCRSRRIRLSWTHLDRPAARDVNLARDYCSWPLSDHSWKKRLFNLGRTAPRLAHSRKRVAASYYYTIAPLITALGAEKDIDPLFYGWPGRRLAGLKGWRNWRFLTAPGGSGLGEDGRSLLKDVFRRFLEVSHSRRYQNRFDFAGLDCWEAVRQRLSRIAADDFPILADAAEKLSAALDREPADLVLVPYDGSPPERLLLAAARLRGIPSALSLHGLAVLPRVPIEDTGADLLLVWGPELVELFAALGYPRERIVVTGYPMLDSLAGLRRRDKPPDSPARVLLVSGIGPIESGMGRVLDLLRKFPGVDVTVKLHPGEKLAPYQKVLAARLDKRCRLEWRRSMEELLLDTDLVVSPPSGAVFEAMALGIPVVLLNLEGIKLAPPFAGGWGLEPVESIAALEESFGNLLPDRVPRTVDHSRLLEAFIGKADGRCAERAIAVLRGLMRN